MNNNNPFDDILSQNSQNSAEASSNPFTDILSQGSQQQQPAPKSVTEAILRGFSDKDTQPPNAFMAGVENFNRAFGNIAEGVLQKTAGLISPRLNQAIATVHVNKELAAQQAAAVHPIASGVGSLLGNIGAATAYSNLMGGIPTEGPMLGRIGTLAGQSAALGGASYTNPGEDAVDTAGKAAAAGALFGVVGEKAVSPLITGLSKILPNKASFTRLLSPKKAAINDVANIVKEQGGIPVMEARSQAANAVGVNMTPGETMGGLLANKEGGLLASEADKLKLQQSLDTQEQQLRPQVQGVINEFAPGGVEQQTAIKNQLYDNLGKINIPDETLNSLKQNPYIAQTLNEFNTSKLSNLNKLPDNNMLKLDAIKQEIDNDLWNSAIANKTALKESPKSLSNDQRNFLLSTRDQLVNTLDQMYPDAQTGYAATRKLAENTINYNRFMSQINKINLEGQSKGIPTLDQMNSRLFGNQEKQDFFLNALHSAGGDVNNAKNVMEVLNDTFKSPRKQILGKGVAANTLVGLGGKNANIIERAVEHFSKGAYNEELVHLMLNPNWQDIIKNAINSGSTAQKFQNLGILSSVYKAANIKQSLPIGLSLQQTNNNTGANPALTGAGLLFSPVHTIVHHLLKGF